MNVFACMCVWICVCTSVQSTWLCSGKGWTGRREALLLAVHPHPIKSKYPLFHSLDSKQHAFYFLWPINDQTIWISVNSLEDPFAPRVWIDFSLCQGITYVKWHHGAVVHCKLVAYQHLIITQSLSCWYSWSVGSCLGSHGVPLLSFPLLHCPSAPQLSLSKIYWNLLRFIQEVWDACVVGQGSWYVCFREPNCVHWGSYCGGAGCWSGSRFRDKHFPAMFIGVKSSVDSKTCGRLRMPTRTLPHTHIHTFIWTHMDFPSIPSDLQGSEFLPLTVSCVTDQMFLAHDWASSQAV